MSYNGSGTFTINTTGQPVVAGTIISASAFNSLTSDLATGLTTAITKDGQTTTTARITFAQGITSSLVTDSSSVSTGSIITAGGAGIAKNLYVGSAVKFVGATSGSVGLQAKAVAGSTTFNLPSADGTSNQAMVTDGSGNLSFATLSTTPGGSTTQVQYNSSGAFAGSANMTFSGTALTLANDASISGLTVGKGGGAVATNTAVGASALNATNTGGKCTAFGYQALKLTTGKENTAVGSDAGAAMTSGEGLAAFGWSAAKLNTGDNNTAIGHNSLGSNTTAANNTAIGNAALNANTTGASNVAVGRQALVANTTASNNTAVGYQAGYSFASTGTAPVTAFGYQAAYTINATDPRITAIGYQALYTNNGGGSYENTAVGWGAAKLTTTGSSLVAMGNESLYANTTGSSNVAIGYQALTSNTTASNNTALGYQAGYSNTAAANTFIGGNAGYLNTSGTNNAALGQSAGYNLTSGASNTLLGQNCGSGLTTGNNNVLVGVGAGTYTNTLTTGGQNVYVGVNASCSSASVSYEMVITTLNSVGKGSSTGYINPQGGGMYQGNNSTLWSVTSDRRLKKNIVDNNIGLDIINQIQVRNFEYRLPEEITEVPQDQAIEKQGIQLGVIAQELQQILPNCVKTESTGVMTVDADNLTWYLVNAVKELTARIKQLEGN